MDCTSTRIPYSQTNYFSKIVLDYIEGSAVLHPFYKHEVTLKGIEASILERKEFKTDRKLLVDVLNEQYKDIPTSDKLARNLKSLNSENTFTICTAHQPNIFTGHLYFIYKILHTVKMAEFLSENFKQYDFVPVFYMGSEDADLDELGNIWLNGQNITWDSGQSGAVGRMKTKGLEKIVEKIEGELSVLPFGVELITLLKQCYLESEDIQTATFKLINALFGEYGVVVLIADNKRLKEKMLPVFEKDIFEREPSRLVDATIDQMQEAGVKVQANPREINLFYLKDGLRERFKQNGNGFYVHNTELKFSNEEVSKELSEHPEHFSPNVILRGLYQETILPDVAFIGGGGELAYWLELKSLFNHYKVPFPVLVLRNSFLFIESDWKERMKKLELKETDLFLPEQDLLNSLVKRHSRNQLSLEKEKEQLKEFYGKLQDIIARVDKSLQQHTAALQAKALKKLDELEKKILRAEKRKFGEEEKQLHDLKEALFPNGSLQERVNNFMPYYAKLGRKFLHCIYENSPTIEQEFVILYES